MQSIKSPLSEESPFCITSQPFLHKKKRAKKREKGSKLIKTSNSEVPGIPANGRKQRYKSMEMLNFKYPFHFNGVNYQAGRSENRKKREIG